MVGREVLLRVDKSPAQPAEPLLSVKGLTVEDDRGIEQVRDVSFEVSGGEIVGIAGVDGNGQTELIDAIAGLRKSKAGTDRRSATRTSPATAARSASTRGSGTSPRTGSGAASCSTSRWPRTSLSTTTTIRRRRATAGSSRSA